MIFLYALVQSLAFAHINSSDVVAMHTPRGVRVVTVSETTSATGANELLEKLLPQDETFVFRKQFTKLGRPITEQNLYSEFRGQADEAVARFVKLAIGLMRLRSVSLNVAAGTAVRYEADGVKVPGRTTPGLIDVCWECYDGAGNREYVAHALGLDVGNLENRISYNPRFTRQLFRGSAALYKLTFDTVERGAVRVGLRIEMDESYQPFVADVPVERERFGQRIFGSSQRVRVLVEAELDPVIFGLAHVEWTEHDRFSVTSDTLPSHAPKAFADVADRPVPDQPKPGVLSKMLRDLNEYVRSFGMLSKAGLDLPGSPFFWEW